MGRRSHKKKHHHESSEEEYSFTAFSESDMLAAGANSGDYLCKGETITMPGSASATLTVTDDDSRLSGDSRRNENANDCRGQQAEITENGQPTGNGGQIYAECYYWLCDPQGNWYLLIEIEQEGTCDNYFTFCDSYGCGVPAPGTELTVYCCGNISCWEPSYDCLGAGNGGGGAPNAAPVAADDAFATDEETSVSGDLLANDTDANDTELSVADVDFGNVGEATVVATDSGNFSGTLTVNADGTFTLVPGAELNDLRIGETETVTFSYTVTDDEGATDTASVTITIEGLNENPEADDDIIAIFSGDEIGNGDAADATLNILDNDSDPEGDAFSLTSVQGGQIGEDITITTVGGRVVTFTVDADGDIEFDSHTDFNALAQGQTDSFTFSYTITDANGGVDDAFVTIVVGGTGGGGGGEEGEEGGEFEELVEGVAEFTDELFG